MNISALEEFGLRCAVLLAEQHPAGPISASRLAEREGLSVEYVSKLMHLFRKAGLVHANRGIQGGFQLARMPGEITILEVLDALKSKEKKSDQLSHLCARYKGQHAQCVRFGDCSVRPVWETLLSYFSDVLRALSLQDLVDKERQARKRIEILASSRADAIKQSLQRLKTDPVATPATKVSSL